MWRVLVGLHNSIKLSFMTAGHTKFAPDWCFGLLKQKFRRTKVDCLEDIAQVVESSASVNEVQLVGSQSGEVIVNNYDWTGFLAPNFERVIQIKRQHHFEITITSPGKLHTREFADTINKEQTLLKNLSWNPKDEFPEENIPVGLSLKRQWYLHDKIAEFCSDQTRDFVCPRPEYPRPSATPRTTPPPSLPTTSTSSTTQTNTSAPKKRQRICGECGETGHNKRTCRKLTESQ